MKEIQLTQGQVALVNDAVFEWVFQWKWCAHKNNNSGFYALRNARDSDGVSHHLQMHVAIWEHHNGQSVPEGYTVDHVDRDRLNNQIENFRLATRTQQNQNQGMQKRNTSGYIGVYLDKRRGKYFARIIIEHKIIFLGYFVDPIEAAHVRDAAAIQYCGEFAVLNFPSGTIKSNENSPLEADQS